MRVTFHVMRKGSNLERFGSGEAACARGDSSRSAVHPLA